MKIAMITPGYLPVPAIHGGAVEVLIQELIKGNEVKGNLEIDCYTIEDKELEKYHFTNCNIIQVKTRKTTKIINRINNELYKLLHIKKWRTSYGREVVKLLRKQRYEYIVIQNNLMAYRDIYQKTTNKNNLIYVSHNSIGNDINHIIIAKLIGKTARKILAVSEYIKQELEKITDRTDVEVLYNCVDINKYSKKISYADKVQLRKKYNINNEDVVFIYSGRIDANKGVLELVRAFKMIKESNIKLLIVGKAWFNQSDTKDAYTNKLIEESKEIKDKVIFTGFINPKNMPNIYKIANCLVVPSTWEEPFGVTALEGMAAGLPIIVTKSGGLVEVVDETCAFIVDKGDGLEKRLSIKMTEISMNKEKAKTMGECAKNRAKNTQEFNNKNYFENFLIKSEINRSNYENCNNYTRTRSCFKC